MYVLRNEVGHEEIIRAHSAEEALNAALDVIEGAEDADIYFFVTRVLARLTGQEHSGTEFRWREQESDYDFQLEDVLDRDGTIHFASASKQVHVYVRFEA